MSGTFPASPAPAKLTITSVTPSSVTVSHSLYRQVRSTGSHRWLINLKFNNMLKTDFDPILGFMLAQDGNSDTFLWGEPGYAPAGTLGGTPLVDGPSQTGTAISTKGWSSSQNGLLLPGDRVLFAGSLKMYMVTSSVDSDGAGLAVVNINTPLIASPADLAVIDTDTVKFTVSASENTIQYVRKRGNIIAGFEIDFVEVP